MKAKFTNCDFMNLKNAFNVPAGSSSEFVVKGGSIRDCESAVFERDPISLYQLIGLPEDAPKELVRELLNDLVREGNKGESKEEIVKTSRLWAHVGNAANASSIVSAFVSLAEKGKELIDKLPL
ncbi:hypothetical protein V1687_11560 [Pseudomonas putida]|uniref:hypothetical protein n=1 Tax=Pseudomonas putida TaxID=303 RepID=UPI002ED3E4B3|nr:hypothetical protein V1687_11560 [Pseudomonas putida]